jgi:hypothetical protein
VNAARDCVRVGGELPRWVFLPADERLGLLSRLAGWLAGLCSRQHLMVPGVCARID